MSPNLQILAPGYDTPSDLPTARWEPAGWGPPGTVRHAEAIGHTVWVSEHPPELDKTPVSDLEAWHGAYDPVRSAALDDVLDDAFGKPKCGVARCVLAPHARFRQHEDAKGRTWYPGEAPR